MPTIHQKLIRDSADLCDAVLEEMTPASMAAMEAILDRLDVLLGLAGAMRATAQA